MLRRQVLRLVLIVDREQPNLPVGGKNVVDDSQATSTPFASPGILPSQLAKAAGVGDEIAPFRPLNQRPLESSVLVIVEVGSSVLICPGTV